MHDTEETFQDVPYDSLYLQLCRNHHLLLFEQVRNLQTHFVFCVP